MKEQTRPIDRLSDREVLISLYLSQLAIILLAMVLSFFVFPDFLSFYRLLSFSWFDVIIIGGGFAGIVVLADVLIDRFVPKRFLDDGGINERVFTNRSIPHMVILCMTIAIAEEWLFRAVLQTAFGLVIASTLFALVHVRYVKKPFLFIFVLLVSFSLGWLFKYTESLIVTITAHFLIDFLFGLYIRSKVQKQGIQTIDL
ncbi:CPBP family intramembrane glutamic endopeptidase [Bacillus sp. FJAT-45037]|uniref:CPBP family intramembrane glutamic endopeptidase n=1 Tax=Bacillus sp. FJAT-45037 TaxID=2011007 RepID=UPI000C23CF74|nr:CPBP family intramembrane glutamic endopeptidase [Bacillus sp. FJAT-45037]